MAPCEALSAELKSLGIGYAGRPYESCSSDELGAFVFQHAQVIFEALAGEVVVVSQTEMCNCAGKIVVQDFAAHRTVKCEVFFHG